VSRTVSRGSQDLVNENFLKRKAMGKHQHLVDLALGGELPKLAIEFFIVFSRFECALKRSGDYAAPGDNAKVNANWDAFEKISGMAFSKR
jgi:hypothetical protein